MRAFTRHGKRGFTLVELMIVVAIIGVLAALAIFGVRRYLASARTAEARNNIGAMVRGAVAAYERETTSNELLGDGSSSSATVHQLCTTSKAVPSGGPPQNKKYQPSTAAGADFNSDSGSSTSGWNCIRFSVDQAIGYQYGYGNGATPTGMQSSYTYGLGNANSTGTTSFDSAAVGDIDGNSVYSVFARGGTVRNGVVVLATQLYVQNEFE